MAVTIGKSTLEDKIRELTALDEKIQSVKGDEKVLRSQAETALLAMSTDDNAPEMVQGEYSYTYAEVADRAEDLRATLADITSWMEQQVAEHVKATRDASKGDITALTEARTALAAQCEALQTILSGAGIDDLPSIPKGRKASSSSSGGGRTVKTSGARYFRVVDHERADQPDSQNTLSSLVYYQSHHVNGARMTTDDFVSWAKSKGVDVKAATPWALDLNDKVTVGMDVIPTE